MNELIPIVAALAILHQDDLKKRTNRITASWRNGCFKKMAVSHHTKPPPYPPKIDVLPKTFLKIILADKLQVWHSSTSPKQQRRPLPSLLYLFLLSKELLNLTGKVKDSLQKCLFATALQLINIICQ